jgi:hypothetical protein
MKEETLCDHCDEEILGKPTVHIWDEDVQVQDVGAVATLMQKTFCSEDCKFKYLDNLKTKYPMIADATYDDVEKHLCDLGVPAYRVKQIGLGAERTLRLELDATGSLSLNGAAITEEILKDFPVKVTPMPNSDIIRVELNNYYPKGS